MEKVEHVAIDFGFEGYTVITKQATGTKWEMHDGLYSSEQLSNMGISKPRTSFPDLLRQLTATKQHIANLLSSEEAAKKAMSVPDWRKIRVFKRERKDHNKMRMVLMLQEQYLREHIHQMLAEPKQLIPILMFRASDHRVEFVCPVRINNQDVGFSLMLKGAEQETKVHITGIHLDRDYIQSAHHLVSSWLHISKCQCFRDWKSSNQGIEICGNNDNRENDRNDLSIKYRDSKVLLESMATVESMHDLAVVKQKSTQLIARQNGDLPNEQ